MNSLKELRTAFAGRNFFVLLEIKEHSDYNFSTPCSNLLKNWKIRFSKRITTQGEDFLKLTMFTKKIIHAYNKSIN